MLDGAIIKTEKETKPIAEKAILIAKETVSTKNSKNRKNRKYRKNRTPSLSESFDRPRQMVSSEHGKEVITEYRIISESERITSESENTFNRIKQD